MSLAEFIQSWKRDAAELPLTVAAHTSTAGCEGPPADAPSPSGPPAGEGANHPEQES